MSDKINAIIIEDEKELISLLEIKLKKNCPSVNLIGSAQTVEAGIVLIDSKKPDLVFMDIRLPDGDGFEILEKINHKAFEVIFITAYNQYTHKAIKFSAFDYLLKPIEDDELKKAIQKYETEKAQIKQIVSKQVKVLVENFKNKSKKIVLKDGTSTIVVDVGKIIKCTSADSYICFTIDGTKEGEICVLGSVKEYEDLLASYGFFRIHKRHLINLKYVDKYLKEEGVVIMKDKTSLPVARRKIGEFCQMLNEL